MAIVGYRTNELPAFTSVSSGLPLEHRVDSPAEACRDRSRSPRLWDYPAPSCSSTPCQPPLRLTGNAWSPRWRLLFKRPDARVIAGKAITPFLLDQIREATGGQSLRANRALLVANARLAAEVAVALHQGDAGSRDQTTDRGR